MAEPISFPRQTARTQRFTLGAPRSLSSQCVTLSRSPYRSLRAARSAPKIIERRDGVSAVRQPPDQMAPDKTGPAGDQHAHA